MSKTICIQEDDPGIREVLTLLLEEENYEVISSIDVSSFSQRKFDSQPNLYLVDVMLPDGNGLDVCELLKNSQKPVVFQL